LGSIEEIKEFNNIEGVIKNRELSQRSLAELRKMRETLLLETPTSQNAQFQQRWERVHAAINSELEGRITARRFRVQLALSVLILLVAAINLAKAYS
jgi:hypothetical protein